MKKTIFLIGLCLLTLFSQAYAQPETKTLRGTLADKKIEMTLTRDGAKITGKYFYTGIGKNLRLEGAIDANKKFKLSEYDDRNVKTGEFSGDWNDDRNLNGIAVSGTWTSPDGKRSFGFNAEEDVVNLSGGAKFISRKFEEKNAKKRFEITAEYPELTGVKTAEAALFNRMAKDLVMKNVDDFRKSMLEISDEDLGFLPEGVNNFLEIGYTVELADARFISIGFGRSEYTGGAHPNHWSFSLNFDRRNSRELKLGDLFLPRANYLKAISDYAIEDLKKQQEDWADDEWIRTGAGPAAENFQSWNLTKKGLMISFDPYQVGPYAAGSFTVIVPFEKLKSVIKKDFAAAAAVE